MSDPLGPDSADSSGQRPAEACACTGGGATHPSAATTALEVEAASEGADDKSMAAANRGVAAEPGKKVARNKRGRHRATAGGVESHQLVGPGSPVASAEAIGAKTADAGTQDEARDSPAESAPGAVVGGETEKAVADNGVQTLELEVVSIAAPKKKYNKSQPTNDELQNQDLTDFHRLNRIIVNCIEQFLHAGRALREIRDRELWKVGGYVTWNAYCDSVQGISRRYANRLISAARTVDQMRQVGTLVPTSELAPWAVTQVTPLERLKDAPLRIEAWNVAVERSGGQQPPGKLVEQVVSEILAKQDAQKPAPPPKKSRAELRADAFACLEQAVAARQDWDLVARLISDLKQLLR